MPLMGFSVGSFRRADMNWRLTLRMCLAHREKRRGAPAPAAVQRSHGGSFFGLRRHDAAFPGATCRAETKRGHVRALQGDAQCGSLPKQNCFQLIMVLFRDQFRASAGRLEALRPLIIFAPLRDAQHIRRHRLISVIPAGLSAHPHTPPRFSPLQEAEGGVYPSFA